jgi:hypothetical protein
MEKKKGWSWLGFLFAPYYYAGFGQWKKAIILMVLSFLVPLGPNIYGGLKAKEQLPLGQGAYHWGKCLGMLGIAVVMTTVFLVAKGQLSNSVLLDDVSGVWRNTNDETLVIDINPFTAEGTLKVQANGQNVILPVVAEGKEEQEDILKLTLSRPDATGTMTWYIARKWDDSGDNFTLLVEYQDRSMDEFGFVSPLK